MEDDLHLKISLRALATVGQWPLKSKFKLINYTHFFYSILASIYFMYFVTTEYIEIVLHANEDFLNIVNNLSVSLLYTVTIYKVYIIRGKAMSKLVEKIRAIERICMNGDDQEIKHIYMQHAEWNTKLSIRFIMITGITLLPFFINPAIQMMTTFDSIANGTNDKPLPFSSWFPFDRNNKYEASYAMQVVAGLIGGYLTCDTDIFYWSLMIFAIGQLKILQYKLRNLNKHAHIFGEDKRITKDDAVAHCLKKCIVLHHMIIEFVNEVNGKLRLLMLMDFGICSMQIGVIGFQVIVTDFGFALLFAVEYLAAMLVQMFLFYWHANEIILESLVVSNAIWEGNIYDYPLSVQKSLVFVMLRAQKELNLQVGPFYTMSTATALSIVRAAYSYIALMRQVYK